MKVIDTREFASKSWVVPFLYTKLSTLNEPTTYNSEGSILFYGAMNARREKILDKLQEKYGDRLRIKCVFGKQLYDEIAKAAVVVNIHYYEDASLELARFNEVLQYKIPIVSESGVSSDHYSRTFYTTDMVSYVPTVLDDMSNIDAMCTAIDNVLTRATKVPDEALLRLEQNSKLNLLRALLSMDLHPFPYNITVDQHLMNCLHLPETPYRIEAFTKQAHAPLPNTYRLVAGVKGTPGWKGCGLSYYNLIWNARRCRLPYVVIFEDDCAFPENFETVFTSILKFLKDYKEWDIFNGCIASLPQDSTVDVLQKQDGIQYVKVDKMHSMVFNIYNSSVYEKILQWDIYTTENTNQIDQFIKNIPLLRIITTHPFIFRCIDVDSTLWGPNMFNTYNDMFQDSHNMLATKVAEHRDNTNHNGSHTPT